MPYSTRTIEGSPVAIVTHEGKFDDAFLPVIDRLLGERSTWVLCHLAASHSVRGDHIEWLIEAHHRCHGKGGAFALCEVPRDLSYVLSIMQLDQFFRMFPNVEEAVSAFLLASQQSVAQHASSEELQALTEIELPTAPKITRRKPAEVARAEREQRVELFVRYVAPGMSYLRIFETLAKQSKGSTRRIDPSQLAQAAKQSRSEVTRVLRHLVELRICKRSEGDVCYDPGEVAEADIAEFLRMWNNPGNHGKVYRWVYHEQQRQAAERGGVMRWLRRLVGAKG